MKKLLLLLVLLGLARPGRQAALVVVSAAPALLCTDWFAEHYAERLAAAAPALALVRLVGEGPIPDAELARVDAVVLLRRLATRRAPCALLGAATRAPNLRWLHTFSAGTDHPIFGQFRDRGVRHHDVVGRRRRARSPAR